MQRHALSAAVAGLLLLSPLVLNAPSSSAGVAGNLLWNGGFEHDYDLDLLPDGWTPRAQPDTFARGSPLAPKEGAWSLEMVDATNVTPGGVLSDPVLVRPGTRYLLSAWTMMPVSRPNVLDPMPPTLGVELGFGDDAPDLTQVVPASTGWTPVAFSFLIPYGVTSLRVALDTQGPNVLRVDEVSLVALDPDGNYLPNPGFELGHHERMPGLWAIPCGYQKGIWLASISEGARALYFNDAAWDTCDRALSAPFVLPPGRYELSGDQFLIGKGIGRMEVTVYGADDVPLVQAGVDVWQRDRVHRERVSFCAPEGSAWAEVYLPAPPGVNPIFWDGMSLVRTGECA